MFNIGYVNLHREIQENVIWQSKPEIFKIYAALMMMVNFKPNAWEWQGQKYHLKPGQTITSINSIVKAAGPGITPQNVRTALKKLVKYGIITNHSTKRGRLITLLNWNVEQATNQKIIAKNDDRKFLPENSTKQLTNHQQSENLLNMGTLGEAVDSLTDELTDKQQTGNQQLTPIEEGNKDVRKAVAAANQGSEEILNLYYQLYENYTGHSPVKNYDRDSIILERGNILQQGVVRVADKLRNYFETADNWTKDNKYPFGAFVKQYNSIPEPVKEKKLIKRCDCGQPIYEGIEQKHIGFCEECNCCFYYAGECGKHNHKCHPDDLKAAKALRGSDAFNA